MVSELAKAISKIGDVLPRVRLQLLIFRTAWMQEASQLLYADIIGFLMRCVEWYEASPWRHAWKAFRDPYKLCFNDIVEKIDDRARRMDDMANTLSQKTINEMHEMLSRVEKNINGQWNADVSLPIIANAHFSLPLCVPFPLQRLG